ncbi:MAG: hypothetical protein ACYC4P_18695 [Thermoanaerobaculia bacterium]
MLAVTLALLAQMASSSPADPPDLLAYIDKVRSAGATEDAQGSIHMVAGIMTGDTVLQFPKDADSGEYGNSYMNSSCVKPGLSSQELAQLRKDAEDRTRPVMKVLKSVADADASGFISSAEGWGLRQTFEFGAKLAFLVEKEGKDRERLLKLLHVTPAEFDSQLAAYSRLVTAFSGTPVRFLPTVPVLAVP